MLNRIIKAVFRDGKVRKPTHLIFDMIIMSIKNLVGASGFFIYLPFPSSLYINKNTIPLFFFFSIKHPIYLFAIHRK